MEYGDVRLLLCHSDIFQVVERLVQLDSAVIGEVINVDIQLTMIGEYLHINSKTY